MKWIYPAILSAALPIACLTPKTTSSRITPSEDSTMQWLMQRQQLYTLDSYTAFVKKMQPVLNKWSAYKVIGLGEGTHGTSEFQTLRAYITRYLIEKKGYRTVCLENSYGWCTALDRYIQTGEGNPDTLMKSNLLGMWQNKEIKTLLQWMKEYNTSHTVKIHVTGMDYSSIVANSAIIQQITGNMHDSLIDSMTAKLVTHCHYMDEAYADLNNGGKKFAWKDILQNGVQGYETAVALDSALREVATDTPTLLHTALYNTQLAFYAIYRPVKEKVEASRDEGMANMVKTIMNNNSGTGIIVWAHNAHISRSGIFKDNNGGGTGAFLEKYFPGQYFVVGTGTAGGQFSATTDRVILNTSRFTSYSLPAAPDSSWEHMMVGQPNELAYFDLTNKSKALPKLDLRFTGYGPASRQDFVKVQLNKLFDGFFFVRSTRGTTMLW